MLILLFSKYKTKILILKNFYSKNQVKKYIKTIFNFFIY